MSAEMTALQRLPRYGAGTLSANGVPVFQYRINATGETAYGANLGGRAYLFGSESQLYEALGAAAAGGYARSEEALAERIRNTTPLGSARINTGGGSTSRVFFATGPTTPPAPHPDASNQSLGPNVGGADGVTLATDSTPQAVPGGTGSGAGGILLLGLIGVAALFLLRK